MKHITGGKSHSERVELLGWDVSQREEAMLWESPEVKTKYNMGPITRVNTMNYMQELHDRMILKGLLNEIPDAISVPVLEGLRGEQLDGRIAVVEKDEIHGVNVLNAVGKKLLRFDEDAGALVNAREAIGVLRPLRDQLKMAGNLAPKDKDAKEIEIAEEEAQAAKAKEEAAGDAMDDDH